MFKAASVILLICLQLIVHAQPAGKTNIFGATWMPDGKSICFTVFKMDSERKNPPRVAIYIMDLKTSRPELLFKDALSPYASPDGKFIAYTSLTESSLRGNTDIVVYDLKNRTQKVIVNTPARESAASWSPDGKKLVYTTESNAETGPRSSNLNIWIVDLATGDKKQITTTVNADKCYDPMWSPKGDAIVYYLEKGDNRDQIYLTDERGSFHTNLTGDTTTHNFYPSWYGDKIIYTHAPGEVVIMDPDTRKRSSLDIKSSRSVYNPKVEQILYATPGSREIQSVLMIYDIRTKQSNRVISQEVVDSLQF
jgi:Tol biopolymer transport system component